MSKEFPRKEVYVYTSKKQLDSSKVTAIHDKGELILPDYLENYAQMRWNSDNNGWISSVIPSMVDVEISQGGNLMKFRCATTKYHKLLGMVMFLT